MGAIAKPEKHARTHREVQAKSCELRASELRQGVSDQQGQDGARQVRCGAQATGMCLQGGGRQNPIIPGS